MVVTSGRVMINLSRVRESSEPKRYMYVVKWTASDVSPSTVIKTKTKSPISNVVACVLLYSETTFLSSVHNILVLSKQTMNYCT